jgi:hypothetical protein
MPALQVRVGLQGQEQMVHLMPKVQDDGEGEEE